MSWVKSSTANEVKPHSIRVSRVRQGFDTVEFNEKQVISLPQAPTGALLMTANVGLDFTNEEAVKSLTAQSLFDPIDAGIGDVVYTLNPVLPSGWAWAGTPGATFPNEPQVPAELRGKPVPDLTDAVPVATSDPTLVGTRVEGTLEAQPLPIDGLSLPAPVSTQIGPTLGDVDNPSFKGGGVVYVNAAKDYRTVQHSVVKVGAFGGELVYAQAIYLHHPAGTKLQGSLPTIKPPTQIKLRAIVRVR